MDREFMKSFYRNYYEDVYSEAIKDSTEYQEKQIVKYDLQAKIEEEGLEYHFAHRRGFIPAGLVEEIRALCMPVIPWDVELARWLDCFILPIEKHRSYARPSRRQGSTPDIPRPRYTNQNVNEDSRTFGVIIDTFGSMSAKMIGMALGSIASYAAAKEVPMVRVVFCDASAGGCDSAVSLKIRLNRNLLYDGGM